MALPLDHLLAFSLAAFILIVIPGPGVLFVISRALAYGRRAALFTVCGCAAGSFVSACAIAIGVGAIVQASAFAYTVLKFAGAAYLVYLGVKAVRQRTQLRDAFERQLEPASRRRTFVEGLLVSITNPKGLVFFAAVLPQFVDRTAGSPTLQMVVYGAVFAVIALASDSVWGLLAGSVRAWFVRSARRLELVGGTAGVTMVGLGVGLALSGRKD